MIFIFIPREAAEWWADAIAKSDLSLRGILNFYFDQSLSIPLRILLGAYFLSLTAIGGFCMFELIRITGGTLFKMLS